MEQNHFLQFLYSVFQASEILNCLRNAIVKTIFLIKTMNTPNDKDIDKTIRFNQIIREIMKLENGNYLYRLSQFQNFVSASQYLGLYNLLTKYIPTNSKVLDWGCGNGHFSYVAVALGYQTSGFSFDSCLLSNELQKNLNYRFIQGDLQEPTVLPFIDQSFVAVVSVGVLEHVRETGGNEYDSLNEIARVLQTNGYFVCYHLPNRFSLIEFVVSLFFPNKDHHAYLYTQSQINSLFQIAGLEIVEIYRYGFLPRNILSKLPRCLRNSITFAKNYDFLDHVLSFPFSIFCQNYAVVARKTDKN